MLSDKPIFNLPPQTVKTASTSVPNGQYWYGMQRLLTVSTNLRPPPPEQSGKCQNITTHTINQSHLWTDDPTFKECAMYYGKYYFPIRYNEHHYLRTFSPPSMTYATTSVKLQHTKSCWQLRIRNMGHQLDRTISPTVPYVCSMKLPHIFSPVSLQHVSDMLHIHQNGRLPIALSSPNQAKSHTHTQNPTVQSHCCHALGSCWRQLWQNISLRLH